MQKGNAEEAARGYGPALPPLFFYINERNYSYYSNLFQYKKKDVVPCCPSCLWYYKNNKNNLGFRLLCNHVCIDILCQYERCSFVT